jgi:hypothetical protein
MQYANRNYSAILATLQITFLQDSENGRVVTIVEYAEHIRY